MKPYVQIAWGLVVVGLGPLGCAPALDVKTEVGRQGIIDATNLALTEGRCNDAIALIDPLYNSEHSTNNIRMLRASAYGCAAGFNFFSFLDNITSATGTLSGSGLWEFMTQHFPATTSNTDRVIESTEAAIESVQAVMSEKGVKNTDYMFDKGTYNPKTTYYTDRTNDANLYLVFMSMNQIGAFHNRYGAPNASYRKTVDLPWITATTTDMDTLGCGYASAIVNFADSLDAFATSTTGQVSEAMTLVKTVFQTVIFYACNIGCQNTQGVDLLGVVIPTWTASGCTAVAASCESCPLALRNRHSCTLDTNNLASCAAAGIVNFMNEHPLGWL